MPAAPNSCNIALGNGAGRDRRRHDQHGARRRASATGTHSIAIGNGATATGSIAAGNNAFASKAARPSAISSASGANSTAAGPVRSPRTPMRRPSATGRRRRATTSRCSARRPTPHHDGRHLAGEQAGSRLVRRISSRPTRAGILPPTRRTSSGLLHRAKSRAGSPVCRARSTTWSTATTS